MKAPKTTTDKNGTEWVHVTAPRFFVYQFKTETAARNQWAVIDADTDLCVTSIRKSKRGALNEFCRNYISNSPK